jgi:4-oxalocrotonate tautomerase
MPHVIVKLWPGKSEAQKTRLAEAITKSVMDMLHYGDESVSVALEEVSTRDWAEKVFISGKSQWSSDPGPLGSGVDRGPRSDPR